MATYYYEDLAVGDRFEFGSRTVTKAEIIEFAERYDPQPFHVDEEAAADSLFGGLCASGWHTVSVCTRMLVDDVFVDFAVLGGRGVSDLRWHKPVRPGDRLSGAVEITKMEPHPRDESRGEVDVTLTAVDDDGETVLTLVDHVLIERRDA